MEVRIFTDGACQGNGRTGAKASYACWFPDNKELSCSGRVPEDEQQTNQRGELMAIHRGVKVLSEKMDPSEIDVKIFTDSTYSKNSLTVWLPLWINNGWKTSTGKDVCHRDLIEETSNILIKFKSYTISYVAAHTGKNDELSRNNHIVDRMAVEVLEPVKETKIIVDSNDKVPFEGCPITLMGPPVAEDKLTKWCREHLDSLDQDLLNSALLSALSKTLKKKGFELEKQKLYRSNIYRLTSGLITDKPIITKEE